MKPIMRVTKLNNHHKTLGAKMAEIAGWEMPIEYAGTEIECQAIKNRCGVFDVGNRGIIMISGPDAQHFLSRVIDADLSQLCSDSFLTAHLLDSQGEKLHKLDLHLLRDEKYFIYTCPFHTDETVNSLNESKGSEKVNILNTTTVGEHLLVTGPQAERILSEVVKDDLSTLEINHNRVLFYGNNEVLISRHGNDSFYVFALDDTIFDIWDKLLNQHNVTPCGAECFSRMCECHS